MAGAASFSSNVLKGVDDVSYKANTPEGGNETRPVLGSCSPGSTLMYDHDDEIVAGLPNLENRIDS
jgi:hypothetical protein